MIERVPNNSNILVIGGHDPSGGAGIQADIETINNLGAHASSLITCHTVQNTQSMIEHYQSEISVFRKQANALLTDINFSAIKIGAITNIGILKEVINIIHRLPELPVVYDPVLAASQGSEFIGEKLKEDILNNLLPFISVLTPNKTELLFLAKENSIAKASEFLLQTGCKTIFLTTTDDSDNKIIKHELLSKHIKRTYECKRIKGDFHGTGCTLSSAIATYITSEDDIETVISHAQDYTYSTINTAKKVGTGQLIPNRFI